MQSCDSRGAVLEELGGVEEGPNGGGYDDSLWMSAGAARWLAEMRCRGDLREGRKEWKMVPLLNKRRQLVEASRCCSPAWASRWVDAGGSWRFNACEQPT